VEIWHTDFGKTSSNWETIKSGVVLAVTDFSCKAEAVAEAK
jgi:hypothetical protein